MGERKMCIFGPFFQIKFIKDENNKGFYPQRAKVVVVGSSGKGETRKFSSEKLLKP
ncbi:hypothetical protein [Archaeoglobus fulgidus]|uniref:hypothetical protein n=1 Tax=Archaeoglobus fulgidus TaxID=2234 RepID=UPI0015D7FD86|nr:hypothetical protein [Archaeoglobus fulgidus]